MSTDHHPSDPPLRDECPSCGETRYVDPAPPACEPGARDARDRTVSEDARTDLEDRIERARLRVRIAALERSLAAQERRRQAVIDQYERVLEDRASEFRGSVASTDSSSSPASSETTASSEPSNATDTSPRTVSPRLQDAVVPTDREPARDDRSVGNDADSDGPLARLLGALASICR